MCRVTSAPGIDSDSPPKTPESKHPAREDPRRIPETPPRLPGESPRLPGDSRETPRRRDSANKDPAPSVIYYSPAKRKLSSLVGTARRVNISLIRSRGRLVRSQGCSEAEARTRRPKTRRCQEFNRRAPPCLSRREESQNSFDARRSFLPLLRFPFV